MEGLTEGRIVHYVLGEGDDTDNPGRHTPAIVVRVWRDEANYPEGTCNLHVFTDHSNDFPIGSIHPGKNGGFWATSVRYDENKAPMTWHWIEKA
jgi:hypothetical protein